MFESRTNTAFGVAQVAGADIKTASFRYQLIGWCGLIAREVVKGREWNNHSALIDNYLLEALEAASELSCRDEVALTKLLIQGDYILQLAQALTEETTPEELEEFEKQISEGIAEIDEPDAELLKDMEAQGAGYLPESRLSVSGAERFAITETIVAALVGVAGTLSRALKLSVDGIKSIEYDAIGLVDSLENYKPRERAQKKPGVMAEADALREKAEEWRRRNRESLDTIVDALDAVTNEETSEEQLFDLLETVGRVNATALELLEKGTRGKYDAPTPCGVLSIPRDAGKCVLYCGDDFDTLSALLTQAEFSGIDVWVHGDAIAAFGYAKLRDRKRLRGCYGGSWNDQQHELDAFPGGTVVDNFPLDQPGESYAPYVFSTFPTFWKDVKTLQKRDDGTINMSPVFRAANDSSGFFRSPGGKKRPVGFGGAALDEVVDRAARAFRDNRLDKAIVVGGQDVPGVENDYYTRLFGKITEGSSFALTFGDVKFRFPLEQIGTTHYGITNPVDVGRERDAYAAIRFAEGFAKELDRNASNVPARFFVSLWGETSVAFLLTLCALGYRDVVVGPFTPECWTPTFVEKLGERFGVRLTSDPESDLA